MSELTKLNFELAFKRVRDELEDQRRSGRAFVVDPFELQLVEHDLESWLRDLRESVLSRSYEPGEIERCSAPKGKGLVRPGTRMSISDRVVLTAAVGRCLNDIVAATKWSQRKIDFAPLLHATKWQQRSWLLKPFVGWEGWTEQTLHKLSLAGTKYVVTADIAGYFENISVTRLRSDLARIDCASEIIELITRCLHRWSLVKDRGLPQGVLASDILAKLYLESFDKRLKEDGYSHVRYADDVRVFCRSLPEANRALVLVTELLRERGLTVQSAKTRIRLVDNDLEREFAGAVPIIKALHREYIEEVLALGILSEDEASVPASVIDDLVEAEPDTMDPEVFYRAWTRFVLDEESPNRTMFRYLLRRFAGLGDHHAVDYCKGMLTAAPDATPEILRYFEDLDDPKVLEIHVRSALGSREIAMYPYAKYLLLQWLSIHATKRVGTVSAVRKQAFLGDNPSYVQAIARAVLARIGSDADLEKMATLLSSSRDPLQRAQLMCCLAGFEKARRNAIAGRLKRERPWGPRAVAFAKQNG